MRRDESGDAMAFLRACNQLRNLTERGYQLYLAGNTLHLMRGDSHDKDGRAQQENIIESVLILGASGGDW